MRRARSIGQTLLAAALALLSGCVTDSVLEHQFAASPVASEELSLLGEMPAGLRVLPDGRWALEASAGDAAVPPPVAFRVESATLLVPIQDGAFDAKVHRVLRPDGVPQVAASVAGVLVAGVSRGPLHPGASVVAVRLADGLTRMVGSWRMPAALGQLGVERLELSPDGRRLACQIVEMHTQKEGGTRERSRRGVVLTPFASLPAVDLGPGVAGPFRWSPDGKSLYFVRIDSKGMTLRRTAFPTLGLPPPPPQARTVAAAPHAVAGGSAGSAAPAPPVQADVALMIEEIVLLSAPDPAVRVAAARALSVMPHPMAVGPLISAMEAGDRELCRVADAGLRALFAAAGLEGLGPAGADVCIDRAGDWREWWTANPDALGNS